MTTEIMVVTVKYDSHETRCISQLKKISEDKNILFVIVVQNVMIRATAAISNLRILVRTILTQPSVPTLLSNCFECSCCCTDTVGGRVAWGID